MYKKISLAIIVFLILVLLTREVNQPKSSVNLNRPVANQSAPAAITDNLAKPSSTDITTTFIATSSRTYVIKYPFRLANQATKKLLALINTTMHHLKYNRYKLGGTYFNPSRGIFTLDCSNYVDHLLSTADPNAYWLLKAQTRCDIPTSKDYYAFFNELPVKKIHQDWLRISQIKDLKAGDILVFRYKNLAHKRTAGHVMVVMAPPTPLPHKPNVFLVRVSDSAPTRHSNDTRPAHTSGIGIGTLLLKVNAKTGAPEAYAWKEGAPWEYDMYFAMARLISPPSKTNS